MHDKPEQPMNAGGSEKIALNPILDGLVPAWRQVGWSRAELA